MKWAVGLDATSFHSHQEILDACDRCGRTIPTVELGVGSCTPFHGLEIPIGNQQVWGKNWGLKVVINKFSVMNLAKKGPKIQVSSMMDRKGDKILSTTSRSCTSSGPRAGLVVPFSIHHI